MHDPNETSAVFHFGIFEVDVRTRELRKQGIRIRLSDQPFQLLRFLLERAGDVVTHDELRQKLWPSSVYVDFDHGMHNAVARVREALGDTAGTPRFIETLPRLGYRFIYPVETVQPAMRTMHGDATVVDVGQPIAPTLSIDAAPILKGHRRVVALGIVTVLVSLGLLAGVWLARRSTDDTPTMNLPKEPSIAVLPFVNIGDDAEQQRFGDGLAEELLDKLAGIHGLRVVGRTASSYFKDKQLPLHVIAKTLNVSHVLEGSVRRSGSRARITVQLIDARDGYHRWSQTYDREFADIFEIQEEIARGVAAALQVQLVDADERLLRRRGTHDPEAYRLFLMAQTLEEGQLVGQDAERAEQFLEEALARDPTFAAAQAGLAEHYFYGAWFESDVENNFRRGRVAAERAVALDPELSEAYVARANFKFLQYYYQGDSQAFAQAHKDYRRAIELDPSNPVAYFDYARAVLWDEPDLAMQLYERSVELNPLYDLARGRIATLMSRRGLHDAARKRLKELSAISPMDLSAFMIELDEYLGRLDEALIQGGDDWSLYLSLGDAVAARETLKGIGDYELDVALHEAALFSMDASFDEAFESLERHRNDFPTSRLLDLPTARFALITGRTGRAREILEARLPDLASGIDAVKASNVIPALDLAAAYTGTGDQKAAKLLIGRIAAFLDGPDAPRLPMFTFLRARTHMLAHEPDMAQRALDRAYEEGFRVLWALDLRPMPLYYLDPIDADPVFAALWADPRFKAWRERIKADNARQLERFRARSAKAPAT